ncbi:MAG: hypothetical protein PHU49_09930 [Syntrophorhabdaceae bacterium]|jgi:hypothetical protein|nr:hypothetical protein [Syntrophorhabdaceae bacterium]
MAKVKMTCPISKGACTECPIYRGRHFYMCFSREYHGVSLGAEQIDELKSKYHKGNNDVQDKKFGMPDDIQKSSRWISNVEELVEVEELEESTERRGL